MRPAWRVPVTAGGTVYEIRVTGELDPHWADWLGTTVDVRHDGGTTTFVATVHDQAEVHGLLAGLCDLGVTLLSLHAVDPAVDRRVRAGEQPPVTR